MSPAAWLTILVALVGADPSEEKPAAPPRPLGVRQMDFSPDGRRLAVVSGNAKGRARLTICDVASRRRQAARDEPAGIFGAVFVHGANELALGTGDGRVQLLDVETMKPVREFPGFGALTVSSDGKWLATGRENGGIDVRSPQSGELLASMESPEQVTKLTLSVAGKSVVSWGGDRTTRLRRLPEGNVVDEWSYPGNSLSTAFVSRDDRFYMLYNNGNLRFRDTASGAVQAYLWVIGGVAALAPDSRTLAVNRSTGTINLFDLRLDAPPPPLAGRIDALIDRWNDDDYAVREAASRELIAIGMDAAVQLRAAEESQSAEIRVRARAALERIWSPEPRRTIQHVGGRIDALAFSPDGKLLAGGDSAGQVILWDPTTGETIARLGEPTESAK